MSVFADFNQLYVEDFGLGIYWVKFLTRVRSGQGSIGGFVGLRRGSVAERRNSFEVFS